MKIDSIIFDLDGTLWNATEAICSTWGMILNKEPQIDRTITISDLEYCMGLPLEKISEKLFPELSKEKREQLMEECSRLECDYLKQYGGNLYPNLEETLEQLYQKYKLYIVSNCQAGYIESFLEGHKLQKYFKDFECIGVTGLPKGENNKLIIERNQLKYPIYVGDTNADEESARWAGIPFVYARYGFGQVESYDYVIDSFKELMELTLE